MKFSKTNLTLAIVSLMASTYAFANVPHTFSAGTPAKASEVNANFENIEGKAVSAANQADAALEKANSVGTSLGNLTSNVTSLENAIAAIESSPNAKYAPSVTVDVDCTEDSEALIKAYSANEGAYSLTFNLTGACEGDFQGINTEVLPGTIPPTPHLILNDAVGGASIIANSSTDMVNVKAISSSLIINGVDIVAGALDKTPVVIKKNGSGYVYDATFTGAPSTYNLLQATLGSSLYAEAVHFDTGENGIRVDKGSSGVINDFSSTSIEYGVRVKYAIAYLEGTQSHANILLNNSQLYLANGTTTAEGIEIYSASSVEQSSSSSMVVNGDVLLADSSNFQSKDLTINNGMLSAKHGSTYRDNGVFEITGEGSEIRIEQGSSAGFGEEAIITEVSVKKGASVTFLQATVESLSVKDGSSVAIYAGTFGDLNVRQGSSGVIYQATITNLDVRAGAFLFLEGDAVAGESISVTDATLSMSKLHANNATIDTLSVLRDSTVYLNNDNTITTSVYVDGISNLINDGVDDNNTVPVVE